MQLVPRIITGGALALTLLGSTFAATTTYAAPTAPANVTQQAPERPGRPANAILIGGLIRVTAEESGLSAREVALELANGKSLAQIAQEHGSSTDAVIATARTKLSDRLQQAVTAGNLTQKRADQALQRFDAEAPQVMARTDLGRAIGRTIARRNPVATALVTATAEVTGLTPQEIIAEWQSGKSLEQIAQEHGSSADEIIEELGARQEARLDRVRELITKPGGSR